MTYLQLINNVLVRLREETITENQIDSDPYLRSIGAHVNDAKDRVEDAWVWGALRGTDEISLNPSLPTVSGADVELPDSDDNHYIIKRILVYPNATLEPSLEGIRTLLRQVSVGQIRERYRDPTNAGSGQPSEFAVTGTAAESGNIKISLWPFPTNESGQGDYWLVSDRVKHQDPYSFLYDAQGNVVGNNFNSRLLVPSLPVYTLATALASRERGEVGGTPTSELFAIADRHLSDAIAQDSALYPDEMIWYSAGEGWVNTNVRTA